MKEVNKPPANVLSSMISDFKDKLFKSHVRMLTKSFESIFEHITPFSDRQLWMELNENMKVASFETIQKRN